MSADCPGASLAPSTDEYTLTVASTQAWTAAANGQARRANGRTTGGGTCASKMTAATHGSSQWLFAVPNLVSENNVQPRLVTSAGKTTAASGSRRDRAPQKT